MLRRGSIIVGDLQPIGVTRPLQVVRHNALPSQRVVISIIGLSALVLFGVGLAWFGIYNGWIFPTGTKRTTSDKFSATPFPIIFPLGIRVLRLTGPASREGDLFFPPADLHRSFLDPNPAGASEQPIFQVPGTIPLQMPIGLAPLGMGRLSRSRFLAWDEYTKGLPASTAAPPSTLAVVVLAPDVSQQVKDEAEAAVITTSSGDTLPTRTDYPLPTEEANTSKSTVDPAPAATEPYPTKPDAERNRDLAEQALDQGDLATLSQDTQAVASRILNPGPAKQAHSVGRTRTPERPSSARSPYRGAQQIASIKRLPELARRKIDAGAVARASVHRAWINRSGSSSVPAVSTQPWTLPSTLAPSD